ncbi:hypothetical protein ACOSP7_002688 [Xanthoceras sorbifolium]
MRSREREQKLQRSGVGVRRSSDGVVCGVQGRVDAVERRKRSSGELEAAAAAASMTPWKIEAATKTRRRSKQQQQQVGEKGRESGQRADLVDRAAGWRRRRCAAAG